MPNIPDALKRSDNETTKIDTNVNEPVEHERVKPIEKVEQNQRIIDDIHHHHIQYRVQPIHDTQVLPTEYKEEELPTQHVYHEKKLSDKERAHLEGLQEKFTNTREVTEKERLVASGQETREQHVQHHIHETIQPVIERETIVPTTVHQQQTTYHHYVNKPIIHQTTIEPPMSVEQFQAKASQIGETTAHSEHQNAAPNELPSKDFGTGNNEERVVT